MHFNASVHRVSKGAVKDATTLVMFNTICSLAGMVLKSSAESVTKSVPDALKYFTQSCEGGFATGCFNGSIIHLQGAFNVGVELISNPVIGRDGVVKDMARALSLALVACERGHYMGCVNASRMLEIGKSFKFFVCVFRSLFFNAQPALFPVTDVQGMVFLLTKSKQPLFELVR